MKQTMTLNQICPGQCCVVQHIDATGTMRRRLMDIGMIENTPVECIGRSPGGDPCAFLIRGAVIAIRNEDAKSIRIYPGG